MKAIKQYNGLNGAIQTREEIEKLIETAKAQEQFHIVRKLENVLSCYPDKNRFEIELQNPEIEALRKSDLPGIDFLEEPEEEENIGLGKAVSPDDIYQMITDLIINTINKVGHLPWQREWEKTNLYQGKQALNFESKKPYRGINYFLLNFKVEEIEGENVLTRRNFDVPYFLTFNQIEKNKGKLKKGSRGFKVVYFTKLYKVDEKGKNGKELSFGTYNKKKFDAWVDKNIDNLNRDADYYKNSYLPILKYYNVFSADDITGIKWGETTKNPNVSKTLKERIEVAELIVKNYPNPPKVLFEGDQPAYMPKVDQVMMTPIEAFKNEQSYYSTFFHELIHSTGHSKRLNRGNNTRKRNGSFADKQAYAFEELVAEMGAVFLCSEAGILFKTLDNSAKYLKGWNSRLAAAMLEDNRYFFRASSKSQAAADHILDRDKEGLPAYQKELEKKSTKNFDSRIKKLKKIGLVEDQHGNYHHKESGYNITLDTIENASEASFQNSIDEIKKSIKFWETEIKSTSKETLEKYSKVHFVLNDLPKKYEKRIFNSSLAELRKDAAQEEDRILQFAAMNMLWLLDQKLFVLYNFKNGYDRNSKKQEYRNVPLVSRKLLKKDLQKIDNPKALEFILEKLKEYKYETAWEEYSFNGKNAIEISKIVSFNIKSIERFLSGNKETKSKPKPLKSKKVSPKPKKPKVNKETGQYALMGAQEKKALNAPGQPTQCVPPTAPVENVQPQTVPAKANPNSLATRMQQNANRVVTYYKIENPDIAKFLGKIEVKKKESIGISLAAPAGAGKTRFLFQVINAFAENYNVGHASIEEHPDSSLFFDKVKQYIAPKNLHNIEAPEINSIQDLHELIMRNDVIAIDSFEKLREIDKNIQVDKDLRKKYDGKIFIIIFQQTKDGKMRGGSKSEFDVDIVLFTEKFPDYRENFIYPAKNRYNDLPVTELKYSIYYQSLLPSEEITDVSDVHFEEVKDEEITANTKFKSLVAQPIS